jgi:predicted  nucleic acid-binding Zn ribbon protein
MYEFENKFLANQHIEFYPAATEEEAVYYYLFYYGKDPQQAACPSCGKNWKLEAPIFNEFHFKCDHCKIISNDQPK